MTKLARTPVLLATSAALMLASGAFAAALPGGGGPCVVNNVPIFTLTPPGCSYADPSTPVHGANFDPVLALDQVIHSRFHNLLITPGGNFNGNIENFGSTVTITVKGKGQLAGFVRTISVQAECEAHSGPWKATDPVISFPTEMMRIEGELVGDPDFASLRIVGGSANGFPSLGQVTAVDKGDGTHMVDSMFNIGYHIEYVGTPDGALKGLSGSFKGVATMKAFGGDNPEE